MSLSLSTDIPNEINKMLLLRILIFSLILFWCLGFSITSFFPDSIFMVFYPFLKHIYSFLCHQVDYKTIRVNDIHFLVCARCTGIYFGTLMTSLIFIFYYTNSDISSKFLFFAAAPMILDIIFYSTGIYDYSAAISFSTGIIFGSTAIVYILIVLQKYFFKNLTVPDDII